jgi:hypothetical protein
VSTNDRTRPTRHPIPSVPLPVPGSHDTAPPAAAPAPTDTPSAFLAHLGACLEKVRTLLHFLAYLVALVLASLVALAVRSGTGEMLITTAFMVVGFAVFVTLLVTVLALRRPELLGQPGPLAGGSG